jgi:hypothetical protein
MAPLAFNCKYFYPANGPYPERVFMRYFSENYFNNILRTVPYSPSCFFSRDFPTTVLNAFLISFFLSLHPSSFNSKRVLGEMHVARSRSLCILLQSSVT